MATIDQIARNGTVSVDSHKNIHKEMISFNELLVAEEFADAINHDEITVREAYENFWSYEEYAEIWGVDGRALLPAWQPILLSMAYELDEDKLLELKELIRENFYKADELLGRNDYNPFKADKHFSYELGNFNRYNYDS